MHTSTFRAVVAGLVLFLANLGADPIIGTGGVWHDVPACAGQSTCAERQIWDNPTQDDGFLPPIPGEPRTLGSILNNTSPYTVPGFSNVQWYGPDGGASLIQDLFFTGLQSYDLTLLVRASSNPITFGWYSFDDAGNIVDGAVLIDGNTGEMSSVRFTPTTNSWGFFMKYGTPTGCAGTVWNEVCQNDTDHLLFPKDLYYSQTARNPTEANPSLGAPPNFIYYESRFDPNRQHFVAFSSDLGLIVGLEDGWTGLEAINSKDTPYGGTIWERLGDFNDLVLQISAAPPDVAIPEPSTFLLLGMGIAAVAGFNTFRRTSR